VLGKTKTLYCFVCRSILSVKEFFGHWRENTGTRNRVTLSLIPIDIAQIKKLVEILILCCEVLGTLATSCLHGHFQLPVPSFVYFSVYRTVTERELQHYLLWLRSVEWQWWLYSDIVCLSFRPTTYDVFLAVRRAKENERQGHFKKTAGKKKKSTVSVSGIVCLSCTWTALVVALRICGFRNIMISTLPRVVLLWCEFQLSMNSITFLTNMLTTIHTVLCDWWNSSLLSSIQFNAEITKQQFINCWFGCVNSRSLIKKFSGNAEIPASGTWKLFLQTGQSNSSLGNLSLQWLLKHSRQNVWRQGNDLGSLKSSKQIEHLVISLTWAWRCWYYLEPATVWIWQTRG